MNHLFSLFANRNGPKLISQWCKKNKWDIAIIVPCVSWLYNQETKYRGTILIDEPKMLYKGYMLQAQSETKILGIPLTLNFTQRHEFANSSIDFEKNKEEFAQYCIEQHEFKKYCIYQSKHPLICILTSSIRKYI